MRLRRPLLARVPAHRLVARASRLRAPRTTVRRLILLGAALGYGWLGATTRPFTAAADLVTALPLAALAGVVVGQATCFRRLPRWLRRRPEPELDASGVLRRAGPWWAAVAGLVALELVNLFASPRSTHPTISSLLADATSDHPARAVAFAAWLALGAFLVTR